MRRRTFLTLGTEGMKASEAVYADVCLYNKTTEKLLIVKNTDFSFDKYPTSSYKPIGVVVIPGSHNVYRDGSCAVMSLNPMHTVGNTGSIIDVNMYFGGYGYTINGLTNYFNQVCYVGSNDSINQQVIGTDVLGSLPSDNFNSVINPYDTDTYYNNIGVNYAPSPYNNSDTRNSAYYQTSSPSSTANALSDFDGYGNTQKILACATAQSDWKTADKITDSYNYGYYPAACCCWRYHTEGTKQGDWYLPAMGELGYIMPKLGKINETINLLGQNVVGIPISSNGVFKTSTVSSIYTSRDIKTSNGVIYMTDNNERGYVRAFLRVK